jgi:hypothetical protein
MTTIGKFIQQLDWIALILAILAVAYGYGKLNVRVGVLMRTIMELQTKMSRHISDTRIHIDPTRDANWRDLVQESLQAIAQNNMTFMQQQSNLLADMRAMRADINAIFRSCKMCEFTSKGGTNI